MSNYPFIYLEDASGVLRLRAESIVSWSTVRPNSFYDTKVKTRVVCSLQSTVQVYGVYNDATIVEKKLLDFYGADKSYTAVQGKTDKELSNMIHGRDPSDNGEFTASSMGEASKGTTDLVEEYVRLRMDRARLADHAPYGSAPTFPKEARLLYLEAMIISRMED